MFNAKTLIMVLEMGYYGHKCGESLKDLKLRLLDALSK